MSALTKWYQLVIETISIRIQIAERNILAQTFCKGLTTYYIPFDILTAKYFDSH